MRVEVPIPRVPPSLYSRGWVSDTFRVGYKLELELYTFLKVFGPGPRVASVGFVGQPSFLPCSGPNMDHWATRWTLG